MKQLSGTSETFMLQGSGQQLLKFSTLVQNLQLFQELPLPGGSSFLPSSLGAGLSCAAGKPTPCPAPACAGLPALMHKRGCQQQAVLQAPEEGAGSRLCLISLLNLLPLRPSFAIAPSWLLFWEGVLRLLVGLRLSLAARVKSEGQEAPEQQ